MIAGLAAGTLAAQSFEVGGHGGTMRLSNKSLGQLGIRDLTRVELDDGWRIGFRTTFNNWRFLGHEVGYAYNRTKLVIGNDEAGFGVHQGFYNFLAYATPEGSRVRPFVAGAGTSTTSFRRERRQPVGRVTPSSALTTAAGSR